MASYGQTRSWVTARRWLATIISRRRVLFGLAVFFAAFGPAVGTATTGMVSQMIPPLTPEFGDAGHRVQVPPGLVASYLEKADELGFASGAYCDRPAQVAGITVSERKITGALAGPTVGLKPNQAIGQGEALVSAAFVNQSGIQPGDRLELHGQSLVVGDAAVINAANIDQRLVVSGLATGPTVEEFACSVLLENAAAAPAIWSGLEQELGPSAVWSLPNEALDRATIGGDREFAAIWLSVMLLAIAAGSALSVSVWGLVLPQLVSDSLRLAIIGVSTRVLQATVAGLVVISGIVATIAGCAVGYVFADLASGSVARTFRIVPTQHPVPPRALLVIALLGIVVPGAHALRVGRRIASKRLATEADTSPLAQRRSTKQLVASAVVFVASLTAFFTVDSATARAMFVVAFGIAVRGLSVYFLNTSSGRLKYLPGVLSSRSQTSMATVNAVAYVALGLPLFLGTFAVLEHERNFPDIPNGQAIVASGWDWGTPVDLGLPTGIDDPEQVIATAEQHGLAATILRAVGDGTQVGSPIGVDLQDQPVAIYVADPAVLDLLGVAAPAGKDAYWARDGGLTILPGTTGIDPGLRFYPSAGPTSRLGPSAFITPEYLERRDVETYEAAVLMTGDDATLRRVAAIFTKNGNSAIVPSSVNWPILVAVVSLLAAGFVVVLIGLFERAAIRRTIVPTYTDLSHVGMPRRQINRQLGAVAVIGIALIVPVVISVGSMPLVFLSGLSDIDRTGAIVVLGLVTASLVVIGYALRPRWREPQRAKAAVTK